MHGSDYYIIIVASLIVIASYFFNGISKRTGIPSVLLLIALGIILKYVAPILGLSNFDVMPYLGILGTVGLILIVLEAALDLKIRKNKKKLITNSFLVALLGIVINAVFLAFLIQWVVGGITFSVGLIYAIPISIMSSAIVIPSVADLEDEKKEFMIYESTFSDILGIMIFYAARDNINATSFAEASWSIGSNLVLTLIVSVVASYLILLIFHRLKGEVKLFLLIAILMLFTSVGKLFHLSTLLLILIFGLMLRNQFLLPKFIRKQIENDDFVEVFSNFNLITLESSFILRTFFFVVFGFSITLASIFTAQVWIISLFALLLLYGSRFMLLRIFVSKDVIPELYISPRGLISILLFFSIPEEYALFDFETGTLLFMIIATSLIMAGALIKYKKGPKAPDVEKDDIAVSPVVDESPLPSPDEIEKTE
ncbi:sodium/proton antiporter (CPA1 family) [Balneicella halophila]|uniref:Sodium/proton antiporter (CPA1 family) n=1 Tax=Balneicella halophila TaxID=1537566 RepID=A0A7L4UR54_BALHA|nr:cation:proton antiporter [Balneicella halophila]PVX52255.1 sodium/proton antiporter (CPA1 family) [Balneicella halophila]